MAEAELLVGESRLLFNVGSNEENDMENAFCEKSLFCRWAVREEGGVRLWQPMTVEKYCA